MVMIVAMDFLTLKNHQKNMNLQKENIFYRKLIFFNTDQSTIDFFDNVHHFQNGDRIESIILECLTAVLSRLNLLEMFFYFLYLVHDE